MNLLAIENELTGPDGEAAMQRYDQVLASLDARIVLADTELFEQYRAALLES